MNENAMNNLKNFESRYITSIFSCSQRCALNLEIPDFRDYPFNLSSSNILKKLICFDNTLELFHQSFRKQGNLASFIYIEPACLFSANVLKFGSANVAIGHTTRSEWFHTILLPEMWCFKSTFKMSSESAFCPFSSSNS